MSNEETFLKDFLEILSFRITRNSCKKYFFDTTDSSVYLVSSNIRLHNRVLPVNIRLSFFVSLSVRLETFVYTRILLAVVIKTITDKIKLIIF